MTSPEASASLRRTLPTFAFLLSAGVLAYEISLMRVLLLASWHHFASVVISIVLLGFGASGTVLALARPIVLRRPVAALVVPTILAAVAMPLGAAASQHVGVEARFVPALVWPHLGRWLLFWLILTVPFLLGATALGAALMLAGPRLPRTYGANLIGSGLGAILAPIAMTFVAPAWLPLTAVVPVLAAAAAPPYAWTRRAAAISVAGAVIAIGLVVMPPHVRLDPFKSGAHIERLVEQGAARRLARRLGPRGVVEAYASDAVHDLPFVGVGQHGGAAPPRVTSLLIDGHVVGAVLDAEPDRAEALLERTIMAFAYDLAPRAPRVLLLDDLDGVNVHLALGRGATRIDIIQPHRHIHELMRGPLRGIGGEVVDAPIVHTVIAEPHHVLRHAASRYDVVQFAGLQSSAAGSGGTRGLGQDHLLTAEGFDAALDRLTPEGVLFVCRGIQTPPRDNLKLLALAASALRRRGVDAPARHVVVVRDFLAVCTIVRREPWTTEEIETVRARSAARELTPVWFDGIEPEELNHPDAMPDPPGDWYHLGAAALLASPDKAQRFIEGWAYDIEPPTDDRPYFHDFCRLRTLPALRDAFGDVWLTRIELAYPFVLAAIGAIGAVAALLILAPLPWLRHAGAGGRGATATYFAAIGLGYLMLEMTFLADLTQLLGDPVIAAAVTIGGFLLLSGAGSLAAQRWARSASEGLGWILVLIAFAALCDLAALPALAAAAGPWPWPARAAVALGVIAPTAFLMGFPLPTALAGLDRARPALVPWAWGVNGFASVIAAPIAVAISMTWGLFTAGAIGAGMYALAAAARKRVPRGHG